MKWYELEKAPDDVRSNPILVKEYVKQQGLALKYADPIFLKDKKMVLIAVKNNGTVLEIVDDELKDDEEVVRCAVNGCFQAFKYVSERLKKNMEIIELSCRTYNGC